MVMKPTYVVLQNPNKYIFLVYSQNTVELQHISQFNMNISN